MNKKKHMRQARAPVIRPTQRRLDPNIEQYPVALTVWPDPQAPLPWTEDAVLWLPDGEPRFGRTRIEAGLKAEPGLLPRPTGGQIEFTMTQDHAFEQGEGLWHGRPMRYLRVWRRTLALGWAVAREVWDPVATWTEAQAA